MARRENFANRCPQHFRKFPEKRHGVLRSQFEISPVLQEGQIWVLQSARQHSSRTYCGRRLFASAMFVKKQTKKIKLQNPSNLRK